MSITKYYTKRLNNFISDMCFLPDDHGSCENSIAQWFYDSRDGVCKQFLYGGCGGNGNRFVTRQDCEQKCANLQGIFFT